MSLGGWWSSINDASAWASFDDARKAGKGDGVGFVLNGDGIVCIDLDDCVIDGVISDEAQRLIDSFPQTFVEFSPSNRGLHLWGLGEVQAGRRFERDGLKIEVYGTGRYLTVTGKPLVKSELAELSLQDLVG
jgi:primase-polymerase (primpol)-like protein